MDNIEITNPIESSPNDIPEKQNVIIKGPKALSSIYEEKPAPKWPKQMNSALPSPQVSYPEYSNETIEKFDPRKVLSEAPDFAKAITTVIYQADFSKINVDSIY